MTDKEIKVVPAVEEISKGINIAYNEGRPNEIRPDCSMGHYTVGGKMKKKFGEVLTFQPIAYRRFSGDIFGERYKGKEWIEFFFIKEEPFPQLACVIFHGFSVDQFLEAFQYCMYEEITAEGNPARITDLRLTVGFEKQKNKKGEEFYKADIKDIEVVAPNKDHAEWAQNNIIYNTNTLKGDCHYFDVANFERFDIDESVIKRLEYNPDTEANHWVDVNTGDPLGIED